MAHGSKRWSVNAFSRGVAPLSYYCDGRPLTYSPQPGHPSPSPVEHLLIGVAGCLALSCRAVLLERHMNDVDLEVVVTADKSAASASTVDRLAHIVASTLFRGPLSSVDAVAVVEEAKALCTVGNTLAAGPGITYEIRALEARAA